MALQALSLGGSRSPASNSMPAITAKILSSASRTRPRPGTSSWEPLNKHGFAPAGRSADRPRDRSHDVRAAIGLLQQHRVRAERKVLHEVAGDEDMRDEALSEDRPDGGDAADFAQADIDDHQIRMKARGRSHRFGRVDFDGADEMTEIFENLGEQRSDHGIVLDDQNTERIHHSPPPPESASTGFDSAGRGPNGRTREDYKNAKFKPVR